jgi:hypothetical protein
MSLDNYYWGNRGHCPKCGYWVGAIVGTMNGLGELLKVTGVCKVHGEVDITSQDWSWDDFNEDAP